MGLFKSRLDNCNNSERSSRRFIKYSNEAPYQMLGSRTLAATLGHQELSSKHFWLSVLSECVSAFIYVFVVCSTRISWTGSIIGHEPNLLAMALSSGISMTLLIFTFRTVHVNPALTISFLLTGRIPLLRVLFYIIAHCAGSISATAFLYQVSIDGHAGALGLDNPHENLNIWQILIVELVISFVVTLATYATCNYSSYSSAKRLILEELGQSSNLFSNNNNNQDINNNNCDSTSTNTHLRHSRHTVAPLVPPHPQLSTNTLINPSFQPSKGYSLNSYHEIEEGNNYEYQYDNHRIYATQQQRSEGSPQVPIEELMQDECQLLAPNGFSLYMTSGQSIVIGLAYTLSSLSGIPATGASLNPARSFGPAFIMNRWDSHWIFWLGPILGAVIAGLFYEFIFSPTRASSMCYRAKLFRFSAQDMAKFGSRSRLYQQQLKLPNQPSSSLFQLRSNNQTMNHQHSPSSLRTPTNNLITSPTILNAARDPQLINTTASVAHIQSSYPISTTFDQISYLQQQHHQAKPQSSANFDRCKSTAIINSISGSMAKPHMSTINLPQRNHGDLVRNSTMGNNNKHLLEQVVYEDPDNASLLDKKGFRRPAMSVAANRRSLGPNQLLSGTQNKFIEQQFPHQNHQILIQKPFSTVHHPNAYANQRPQSMSFVAQPVDHLMMDDDLYNVLSDPQHQQTSFQQHQLKPFNHTRHIGENSTSDSTTSGSQRTSEMQLGSSSAGGVGGGIQFQLNGSNNDSNGSNSNASQQLEYANECITSANKSANLKLEVAENSYYD